MIAAVLTGIARDTEDYQAHVKRYFDTLGELKKQLGTPSMRAIIDKVP